MRKTKIFTNVCLSTVLLFIATVGSPWVEKVWAAPQIRITEIMYDPSGNGDREFIEFYNGSNTTVSIAGWSMVGVDFVFPGGSSLAPGSYAIIARNSTALSASHPSAPILGQYAGKLRGTGEVVQILDSTAASVSSVTYAYGGAWPSAPRNGGPSLSLVRPTANETLAACWGASTNSGGTPGYANSVSGGGGGCSDAAFAYSIPPSTNSGNTSGQAGSSPSNGTTTPTKTTSSQKSKQQKQSPSATAPSAVNENGQAGTNPEQAALQLAEQIPSTQMTSSKKAKWSIVFISVAGIAFVTIAAWLVQHYLRRKNLQQIINKHKRSIHAQPS